MRVLVVDQDSASNLAITRSLRDLYTVDCVTNKGDSLDLLRANTYEVIVATERLEDGSGLELLGTISRKWPSVLRIFAAERQRLQLLRGRLGPFELFQTLVYPIDPQKLVATLQMAAAAQHGEQEQIELTDEAPPEEPEQQQNDSLEPEQSDEFEQPRFARAGRASAAAQVSSASQRPSGRGVAPAQARPTASAQRARSAPAAAPADDSSRGARARRSAEPNRANELAAKFPGSGTIGPRRAPGVGSPGPGRASGGAARNLRPRSAAAKAPPVRFPPLERTPPLERIPPLEPPSARNPGGEFSEAAAMARAARSNYESSTDELDTKRLATLMGGGVAVAAVVVFLAFKMFGSKSEAPKPAAPVVAHAPEYSPEVTDLIAQIEAAFKADDFKTARVDVDKLRQLSPSHPRLGFFDGLLSAKSSTTASGRGAGKKNGKSGGAADGAKAGGGSTVASSGVKSSGVKSLSSASTTAASTGAASPGAASSGVKSPGAASSGAAASGAAASSAAASSAAASSAAASGVVGSASAASPPGASGSKSATGSASSPGASDSGVVTAGGQEASSAATSAATGSITASNTSADASPGLAPETPAGMTRASVTPSATASPEATSASAPAASAAAEPAHAPAQASPAHRRGAGEPPPVVQEAKLVRRVNPDYPSAAKKEGISGFVDLEITISSQGVVEDATVIQSTPPGMFDKSAVAAVRKWKYDPRFVDGIASNAHLKVHLEFAPNR